MNDCVDCDLDQFADDSTAHTIGPTVDIVLTDLQNSTNQLQSYSNRNSLTIHPDKCEILVILKKRFIGPLMDVKLCGKNIDTVKSSKCLGFTIDDDLKWDAHCQKVSKAFSLKVRKLYQMREMPKSTLLSVYFQGILPSVIYGIIIWGNCSSTLMNSIEKIHVRAAKFIHRIKKSTPDTAVLEKVKWKPIVHYYKRSLACKAYKIYNGLSSPLLTDLLKKSESTRVTRNAFKVDLPSFKYVDFKRSFKYRVAIVWNNIPNSVREKKSFTCFKGALKKSDILDKISFSFTGRALNNADFIY